MKIVFLGSVDFSRILLECVLEIREVQVVGIVTLRESAFNSDFVSLGPVAERSGIPYLYADGLDQNAIAEWVKDLNPGVIYCFGWSRLLKHEILAASPLGVIGYHPTALPANRGRHPIIWALALGLRETASTFFFMDDGADSGDILSQETVLITDKDDATTLYRKLVKTAKNQVNIFTLQLASGGFPRIPQDHSKASYWRKRTEKDGQIDWRMSSRSIYNLIRALTRPYPGAYFIHNGKAVRIWSAEPASSSHPYLRFFEPGKVIRVDGRDLYIKCGEGVIRIIDHELNGIPPEGCYL